MTEPLTTGQILYSLIVFALFLASPAMAIAVGITWWLGKPLVPFETRSRTRLGWADVGVPFLVFVAFNLTVVPLLLYAMGVPLGGELSDLSPAAFLQLLAANAIGTVAPCLLLLGMVQWRAGSSLKELGLTLRRAAYDIRLGIGAFLLLSGFVYLIQSILFNLFPQQHPLLEIITKHPEPRLFVGAFVSAALVAPLCEELFFRGALQGWIEKFFLHSAGEASPDREFSDEQDEDVIWAEPAEQMAKSEDPYASPQSTMELPPAPPTEQEAPGKTAWIPIVISSLLFALAHLGQGPAPIPLFILAIGLGYLYQKTHRLLPCITVHFLLNATSITMLWLYTSL